MLWKFPSQLCRRNLFPINYCSTPPYAKRLLLPAAGYEPFQACCFCMDVGPSIFALADLTFFCAAKCAFIVLVKNMFFYELE